MSCNDSTVVPTVASKQLPKVMKMTQSVQLLLLLPFILAICAVISADPHVVNYLPGYQGHLPFTLETGYVGVGESEEVQLFYYFVESERDVATDPLMLWLTGGPGCSAFNGLVFEIGPFTFDYDATSDSGSDIPMLRLNPYSWTKVASIIFLDSPVGTGFSYATTYEGYHSNDTLQSSHIYQFLRKWLTNHPNFRTSPLYISGDSYAGQIVPIIVQQILTGNQVGLVPKMDLKGYVIGNPSTVGNKRKNSQIQFLHRVSLVSDELYRLAKLSCNGDYVNIDATNIKCLRALAAIEEVTTSINNPHILETKCLSVSPKLPMKVPTYKDDHVDSFIFGERQLENSFCRNQNYLLSYIWLDNIQVRKALNIREGTVDHWVRCNNSLAYTNDFQTSVVGYHQNLTNKYLQVLVYSGDQDNAVPYIGTLEWIEELKVATAEEWRPWFVDGQVAGYVTEFGSFAYQYHLVYTTIKGAGHTAPEYKPKECLAMIERWFELSPL
ncbi:serine carboxypeptidase-like 18 isoform X2 [Silene latifolia]|uniref:serine carboxypeptidase-like 18 isoform X2 n=1 Tax=Silene latifolia TaxID=37657 RepID=UPI003D789589